MSKKTKIIIIVVVSVVCVAAAAAAVIIFREQIKNFFTGLVDKVMNREKYSPEELEDFADI